MSDRRAFRLATTGARLLTGTLVAAGFAVAVVTAISLPWPVVAHDPVRVDATPEPSASVVVCDGPILAIGRRAEDAAGLSVAAPAAVTSGVAAGSAPAEATELTTVDVPGATGIPVYTTAPVGEARVDVAAASSATVAADDLAGFTASDCGPALLESWLVGGSGTVGAADLVLLANPGDVAASVQLTVFGTAGPATPPGGTIVLAPRTQQVLPLAGLALGEETPVIRVSATGAPVRAALQSSITRTLVPGGIDQSGAIAAAHERLVVTGVVASGATEQAEPTTVLRLLSPSADATATVTVTPVGSADPASSPTTVPLLAGSPVEATLGTLPAGAYTVAVEASAPVVGAIRQSTGLVKGDDFAWLAPADEISVPTLFATPAGPPPRLFLTTSETAASVRISTTDGSFSTEVDIAAQSSAELRLPARGVYVLDPGDGRVRAAVTFSSIGALAGFPVWPADAGEQAIGVYP